MDLRERGDIHTRALCFHMLAFAQRNEVVQLRVQLGEHHDGPRRRACLSEKKRPFIVAFDDHNEIHGAEHAEVQVTEDAKLPLESPIRQRTVMFESDKEVLLPSRERCV